MGQTREEILTEAGRISGTVNNIIPNLEDFVKKANLCKPLDATRRGLVQKVQEHVKRLQEEQKKLEQLIKLFKLLKPDAAVAKTGVAGVAQKLNPVVRNDKAALAKMEGALTDVKTAIANGNKLAVEK